MEPAIIAIQRGKLWEAWNEQETHRLGTFNSVNKLLEMLTENGWRCVAWRAEQDARVTAIRENTIVGRNTLSVINCWRDQDLVVALNGAGVHTAKESIAWAKEQQEQWRARYGYAN